MPFTADTFTHLFDWEKDPQRQEKIINARLEAEFDGVDVGLSAVKAGLTAIGIPRTALTANRTYYVRSDGSDSNTGLIDSSGGAFLTWTKAVDVASALDLSIYNVTIQCNQTGVTFTERVQFKSIVGYGSITLLGDETTPANVLITTAAGAGGYGVLGALDAAGVWFGLYVVRGIKITHTGGNAVYGLKAQNPGAIIQFKNVNFGAAVGGHIYSEFGGYICCIGAYSITAGTGNHVVAHQNGTVSLNQSGGPLTVTLTGTPAFSGVFAFCHDGSFMRADAITYSGAATGSRYGITTNGVINTGGGGANYFPGNAVGTTATGGQYV